MASFRFPFSFSQPSVPKPPPSTSSSSRLSVSAVAVTVTFGGAAIAASRNQSVFSSHRSSPLPWGSIALADSSSGSVVVEPKTGFSFPATIGDSMRLLGVGLRRKSVLGLKNIDVYAFGMYADCDDVKKLIGEKYANLPASELRGNKAFIDDLLEADVKMTIRLQIVFGKLSIRSVRSAFKDSVGNRLKKFGGLDNDELLQSFTSLFKDEYKIPRSSTIDMTQGPGHVLNVSIEGNQVGSVKSKLLCRSILDLYIGEEPFDKNAREDFLNNVASIAVDEKAAHEIQK
ncbi:BnaA09g55750D [Brassica napus]|uniref:(rape) hypothetical protein n=1 Tax=Brassica napus TaxID=3708 RepID=A0A078J2Q0_BRANA|nr:fatty-acid-binding protein 1 [Brassica napus]CAF2049252.1 unnamed protein product [Brassica napus]CDY56459.1 BnaA09g55750D [Brassica napus]